MAAVPELRMGSPLPYSVTWKSLMRGEDERSISFGDMSIMFIRLTLVKVDDHFN